jgi:hypothetical protein
VSSLKKIVKERKPTLSNPKPDETAPKKARAKAAPKKAAESTTEPNLVQKIAKILTGIEPMFKSEQAGSGNYGYKFISINAMLDIARPKLAEAGIIFYGSVQEYEREHGLGKNGNQTFVYLTVRWFVRDGDEEFSFVTLGEASDTGDKAANKAFTAAQKQAVSKLLMMSGTDEDNDANISPRDEATARQLRDRGADHPAVIAAKERKSAMDRTVVLLKRYESEPAKWSTVIANEFPHLKDTGAADMTQANWEEVESWLDGLLNQPAGEVPKGEVVEEDETAGSFDSLEE